MENDQIKKGGSKSMEQPFKKFRMNDTISQIFD
jgi:hypothetical protein